MGGWPRDPMLAFIEDVARGAGRILLNAYGGALEVRHKGEIDLVTEVDTRSEEYILKRIQQEEPKALVLSEEFHSAYKKGAPPEEDCWIIDPLDGTTNFAHAFPWFAVSIARYHKGRPLVGAVYLPVQDEFFWAKSGEGAFLNQEPIKVSKTEGLSEALMATGFPYDVHERPQLVLEALKAVLIRVQGVRRAGAAAIDLVYVASGRLDGFWEVRLKPWDTAAGAIIVEEAGGTVSTFDHGPYNPFLPEVLATNGRIHDEVAKILKEFSELHGPPGSKRHKNPLPTVDIIIRLTHGERDGIVLVKRRNPPLGWALPGGFVDYGESAEDAAMREALEETGLKVKLVELLGAYSDPDRDPRFHTISLVYVADAQGQPRGGDDASLAKVFSVDELPEPICFDHKRIIQDYKERFLNR